MRQCATKLLKPGMILARPVYDQYFRMLVGQGVKLTEEYIRRLQKMEINFVFIFEEGTDAIVAEDLVEVKHRKEAFTAFDQYTAEEKADKEKHSVRSLGKSSRRSSGRDIMIRKVSDSLLKNLAGRKAQYYYPGVNLSSNPTFNHSFDVSLLSLMIGMRYHYPKPELQNLAEAAILHDIGKMALDPDLLKIQRKNYSPELREKYRLHPQKGAEIVLGEHRLEPSVAVAIEQHHEHHDGSGFPGGLKGSDDPPFIERRERGVIFRHAEIIAVANYFDNLINGRVDGALFTPIRAVERLIRLSGSWFHPDVVAMAVSIINVFPLGCNVSVGSSTSSALIDYRGVVAEVNPLDLNKPKVLLLFDKYHNRLDKPILVNFGDDKMAKLEYIYNL